MTPLPRHLHAFVSPRLEVLAAGLAGALRRTPAADTLRPARVAVSARGVERWLRMRLADELGVVFGLEAPFPRDVVMEVLAHLLPGRRPDPAFAPANLAWAIHHLLAERLEQPAYGEVRRYLEDADPLRRWQLARQLAQLYDDLNWQRPAQIKAWEQPRLAADDWRADLWQACRALWPDRETLSDLYFAAGTVPDGDLCPWPGAPLHFFAVHDLPAPALDLLWKVAAVVPVQFHLLAPSPLYLGDLEARPFAGWPDPRLEPDAPPPDFEDFAAAPDHPLVAANHHPLREFIDLLLERDTVVECVDDEPERAPPGHLLAALQSDLHSLRESVPGAAAGLRETVTLAAAPNLRREVEDLRDWILDRFAADPSLRPRDVVVLAPDLEAYAPYIEAVLADPPPGEPTLPYTLADRRPRAEYALADAFLVALELADSRFEAPAVLAWLERAPVRQAFQIEEGDLVRLRSWLVATGIRWGRDAAQVEGLGLPAADAPTWERGLGTLLLGLAADGSGPRLMEGWQPWEHLEGSAVGTLGSLVAALDYLRGIASETAGDRPVREWVSAFRNWLSGLGRPALAADGGGDPRPALRALDEALVALAEAPAHAAQPDPVGFAVARAALDQVIGDRTAASGSFLAGAITFAPLQPLRALPARLIAVLGLGDGAFPRIDRPPAFSPLARRMPGERSIRLRDRQLFLDLILCARDELRVSWPAGEGRGGTHTPPAIVVAELLDVLGRLRANARGDGRLAPNPPLSATPLQAFSPQAFDDVRTAGFSPAEAAGARALALARSGQTEPWPQLVGAPLPPPTDLPWVFAPADFAAAIAHPCRAFARHRLRLQQAWEEEPVGEREDFAITPLHRARLYTALAETDDPAARTAVLDAAASRGMLPPGSAGLRTRTDLLEVAAHLAERAAAARAGLKPATLDLDLDLGPIRVRGRLPGLHLGGDSALLLGLFGAKELNATRRFTFAVQHLLAATAHPRVRTVVLSATDSLVFLPPEDPLGRLHALAQVLAEGLCAPLPVPPGAAWAYAWRTLHPSNKARKSPLDTARDAFRKDCPGDPDLQRFFPDGELPETAFIELAGGIWMDLAALADPTASLIDND